MVRRLRRSGLRVAVSVSAFGVGYLGSAVVRDIVAQPAARPELWLLAAWVIAVAVVTMAAEGGWGRD